MKKLLLLVLLTVVLAFVTGFLWATSSMQGNNLVVSADDLSDDGLTLIYPSHPDFDKEISSFLKKKNLQQEKIEAVKPFSLFLRNESRKSVIAYVIRWEVTRSNGETTQQYESYIEPETLMGGKLSQDEENAIGYSIRPKKSRLLSWGGIGDGLYEGNNSFVAADTSGGQPRAEEIDNVKAALDQATGLKAYLDCAIFDDGTAVGPDGTGFFPLVQAQVQAKRDLLQMIHRQYFTGMSTAVTLNMVQAIAEGTEGRR